MTYHIRAALCWSIVITLASHETSALHTYTNGTSSNAGGLNASVPAFATPSLYGPQNTPYNSTNRTLLYTGGLNNTNITLPSTNATISTAVVFSSFPAPPPPSVTTQEAVTGLIDEAPKGPPLPPPITTPSTTPIAVPEPVPNPNDPPPPSITPEPPSNPPVAQGPLPDPDDPPSHSSTPPPPAPAAGPSPNPPNPAAPTVSRQSGSSNNAQDSPSPLRQEQPNNPEGLLPVQTVSADSVTILATPLSTSQFLISSQTLTPGGIITVNDVPISLPTDGSSIVIGSSTIPFSPTTSPPSDNVGTVTIANTPVPYSTSGSAVILDGSTTLTPGSTITINNVPISLPTSGSSLVIGSSTIPINLSPLPTAPPITAAPLVIQGQTLTPGGVITISGTPISLPSSGSALIVGGSSIVPLDSAQIISIGSQALSIAQAGPSGVVIDGQTLTPGGVITVSGTPISLPSSGSSIIVGGTSTIPLGAIPAISIGSQGFPISQAAPASSIVIGGQTLTPGGVITVSGTPISLPISGSNLILGGSSTIPLSGAQTISIGSQALVVSPGTGTASADLVINGQTIAPGSEAVISGITVSVPTSATGVIIGGTTTAGLGGAILSGLGIPLGTATASATPGGGDGSATSEPFAGGSLSLGSKSRSLIEVVFTLGAVGMAQWLF